MSLSTHLCSSATSGEKIAHLSRFVEINDEIPKWRMPSGPMSERAAASIIDNELKLDGNPHLNLASFVTTEVDRVCEELIVKNLNKNLVDTNQYPHTTDIQDRCVNILANLFHAPTNDDDDKGHAVGTATIGSSEAIMLAGLAFKCRWRQRLARQQDKNCEDILTRCNLIFSGAVHVSVLKLCRYFDIEPRIIPLEHHRFTLNIDRVVEQCDENTCGVLAILGTTLTGEFEEIERLNEVLIKLKKEKGLDIPIHVDGASGAMVVPFVFPQIKWDFQLEHVRSINTSGHKYGLVLPGLGWIIWRSKEDLPEHLIFHVNYLGIDEETFNLNFSRSAAHVIAQYYQFLRLGFQGYQRIMKLSVDNAKYLADALMSLADGLFLLRSRNDQPCLPMVAFSFNPAKNLPFNEQIFVHRLRERGWIVPCYTLAANANDITVCRIVVRESFTHDLVSILLEDIRLVLIDLANQHGHPQLVQRLQRKPSQTYQHRRSRQHHQHLNNHLRSKSHPHIDANDQRTPEDNNANKTKKTVHVLC